MTIICFHSIWVILYRVFYDEFQLEILVEKIEMQMWKFVLRGRWDWNKYFQKLYNTYPITYDTIITFLYSIMESNVTLFLQNFLRHWELKVWHVVTVSRSTKKTVWNLHFELLKSCPIEKCVIQDGLTIKNISTQHIHFFFTTSKEFKKLNVSMFHILSIKVRIWSTFSISQK